MEYGCPVCNGLITFAEECNKCKQTMEDLGRIEDFYTPYSPYEEQDDLAILQESTHNCIHLFHCLECNNDQQILIPLREMPF